MNSIFGKINLIEATKGLIVAVTGSLLTALYNVLISGVPIEMTFNFFKPILMVGVTSGISYLIKTLFQNSNGEVFKSENK